MLSELKQELIKEGAIKPPCKAEEVIREAVRADDLYEYLLEQSKDCLMAVRALLYKEAGIETSFIQPRAKHEAWAANVAQGIRKWLRS
jgi:hypothetical protein